MEILKLNNVYLPSLPQIGRWANGRNGYNGYLRPEEGSIYVYNIKGEGHFDVCVELILCRVILTV